MFLTPCKSIQTYFHYWECWQHHLLCSPERSPVSLTANPAEMQSSTWQNYQTPGNHKHRKRSFIKHFLNDIYTKHGCCDASPCNNALGVCAPPPPRSRPPPACVRNSADAAGRLWGCWLYTDPHEELLIYWVWWVEASLQEPLQETPAVLKLKERQLTVKKCIKNVENVNILYIYKW